MAPSRDGKECLLGIYTVGDVFGELCLAGGTRTETMIAMTRAVMRRIPAAKVVATLDDVGLREEFVRYLACRLSEQQQLITDLRSPEKQTTREVEIYLTGNVESMPTASLAAIKLEIDKWEEMSEGCGKLQSIFRPRDETE